MRGDPPISKEAYLHAQRDTANLPPERSIQDAVVRHARGDLDQKHRGVIAWLVEQQKDQPSFFAEIKAMVREGIKDIRQTMNEVFFSMHEHAAEPGTPLNPTQIMTTDDLRPDAFNHNSYDHDLSMYAQRGNDQERGMDR